MEDNKIKKYGDELYDAWLTRGSVPSILEREPDISIEDLFKIQWHFVLLRLQAGEKVIGNTNGAKVKRALMSSMPKLAKPV